MYFNPRWAGKFGVEPCTIRKIVAGRHTMTVEGKYNENDIYVYYNIRHKYGYEMANYSVWPSNDSYAHFFIFRTQEECMDFLVKDYEKSIILVAREFKKEALKIGYTKECPKIKLYNGNEIPQMGFGVYQIKGDDLTEHCVLEALKIGYTKQLQLQLPDDSIDKWMPGLEPKMTQGIDPIYY